MGIDRGVPQAAIEVLELISRNSMKHGSRHDMDLMPQKPTINKSQYLPGKSKEYPLMMDAIVSYIVLKFFLDSTLDNTST